EKSMRTRLWVGGIVLAAAVIIGGLFTLAADPAPVKGDGKPPQDDRDGLSDKIVERISVTDSLENLQLKETLRYFSDRFDVPILVDTASLRPNGAAAVANAPEDEAILNQTVTIPAMKKVRFATVLKHLTDQINGGYLIYPDHIKIVGTGRLHALTAPT